MPDLEGIGDAVTGGLVGRAVEPPTGRVEPGHTSERNCLNCGTPLSGDYCHSCGQRAHVHRTLTAFWHDLAHGVLHFEGKIWHTLPLLVWKPGELTRRYIDGQRARFVSPIALFLFSVFLTFAVMGLTGALNPGAGETNVVNEIAKELSETRTQIDKLEADRAAAVKAGRSTASIDSGLADAKAKVSALESARERKLGGPAQFSDDTPGWIRGPLQKARANPELLFYKLKTNAYKFSWALIPISVPFVWLLFPFSRRFRLYDHTVFVTYSLSFMMLLLVTGSLVALALPEIAVVFWFVPPVHMYRQLRGTYGTSRSGALWRTVALTLFAFIAVLLFLVLLVGIGAFD
ncbi:MAG TPA: DUF3667 domain-containing protein [Sphingomicrobium sp.]|nr:DUF3667 domain-containing protein [Sphingomicrobium sp.]